MPSTCEAAKVCDFDGKCRAFAESPSARFSRTQVMWAVSAGPSDSFLRNTNQEVRQGDTILLTFAPLPSEGRITRGTLTLFPAEDWGGPKETEKLSVRPLHASTFARGLSTERMVLPGRHPIRIDVTALLAESLSSGRRSVRVALRRDGSGDPSPWRFVSHFSEQASKRPRIELLLE